MEYRIFSQRRDRVVEDEGSLHCYSEFFMDRNGEGIENIYSTTGEVLDINREQTESVYRGGSVETFSMETFPKYIFQRYVGKKDKDGEKIFEGDTVSFYYKMDEHGDAHDEQGVVCFDDHFSSFCIKVCEGMDFFLYEIYNIKVTGNSKKK